MKEIKDQKLLEQYIKKSNVVDTFDVKVLDHLILFEYDKNEYICRDGELVDYVLLLVKGEVKIYTTLENGKSYLLRIEQPYNIYGDIELLNSDTYCANVEALKSCHVLAVSFQYVRKHYLNNPNFLNYLCKSLGHRLNTISQMSTENLYLPLVNKLAGFLTIHMNEETNEVILKRSFTDISDQLGATYRHLSRTFKTLESKGIIKRKGKTISILKPNELKELAGSVYRY